MLIKQSSLQGSVQGVKEAPGSEPLRSSPGPRVSKLSIPSHSPPTEALVASPSPSKVGPVRGSQSAVSLKAPRSCLGESKQSSTSPRGGNSSVSSLSLTPPPSSTDFDILAVTPFGDMSTLESNGPRAAVDSSGPNASDTSLDAPLQGISGAKEDLSIKETDRPHLTSAKETQHDNSASLQRTAAIESLLGKLHEHALAKSGRVATPSSASIDAVGLQALQGGGQLLRTAEKVAEGTETVTVVTKEESTTSLAEIAQEKMDLVARKKKKKHCFSDRDHHDNCLLDGPATRTRARKRRCQEGTVGTPRVNEATTNKATSTTRQKSIIRKKTSKNRRSMSGIA